MSNPRSINLNMPLRFLLFIVPIYERLLDAANLYKKKLVKIPRPEFITLYNNGKGYMPDRIVLRLSDAFKDIGGQVSLESEVVVYNINQGRNPQMMNRSRSLADYAAIIAKIREYQAKGQAQEETIMNAVLYCKEHGIMKDFLQERGAEVLNMLNMEFKLEDALAVRFEEGMEEGLEKKAFEVARSMIADGLPAETVRKYTGLDESAILSLR